MLGLSLVFQAHSEKIWTNSASGSWENGTNWSGHTPPDITSFIQITNDNAKTITIDALTLPANLTVQSLTLSAPPGATNTLLLSSLGLSNPLTFQTGLELQDGAELRIINSALLLQLTNDHVNIDGRLTLDSGSIDFGDTTVTARVGRVTSGVLTLNSGEISAGTMTVGGLTNSTGTVNLNGGTLNVSSLLSVGRNGSTTGTFLMSGGQLNVPNDDTRIGDEGIGQMAITNSTASLTNLDVGRNAPGALELQTGGVMQILSDVSIGRFGGSTGAVTVVGGQLLAPGRKIYVARAGNAQLDLSAGSVQAASLLVAADTTNSVGVTGILTVAGGTLALASNLWVGSAGFAGGQAVFNGGTISVTNAAGIGLLGVPNGSLTLNGGSVTTDRLVLTNGSGQFILNGGTLVTKGTTIANGAAFVVGNGTTPATLHLDGGQHSFANGLVISANARLEGCGTILGSIINHGTIATNCSGVVASMTLSFVSRNGTTNTIASPSVTGLSYTLEYKNSLTDPNWTDVPPPISGTGNPILLRDATANGASRFYRVRAQ
jgi:T5SS/PEP-CTERM-associated repeat protein